MVIDSLDVYEWQTYKVGVLYKRIACNVAARIYVHWGKVRGGKLVYTVAFRKV